MGWIPRTVLNYKLHYTPPILMSILVTACIILIFDISDHTMQDISIFSIEIDIISNLSIQGGTSNHISSIDDSKSFTVIMLSTLFTQLVLPFQGIARSEICILCLSFNVSSYTISYKTMLRTHRFLPLLHTSKCSPEDLSAVQHCLLFPAFLYVLVRS